MEGRTDRSSVLRLLCDLLSTGHHRAVGRDLIGLFSRGSLQEIIEIGLQARDTVSFGIDGAHDRTGCIAIGIGSIKDRFPFNTGDVELADFTIGDRIDILFQIDVGRIPKHHAAQFRLADTKERRELFCGLGRTTADNVAVVIFMLVGRNCLLIYRNVVGLNRIGQNNTVNVKNFSTFCANLTDGCTYSFPLGGKGRALEYLNNDELDDAERKSQEQKPGHPIRAMRRSVRRLENALQPAHRAATPPSTWPSAKRIVPSFPACTIPCAFAAFSSSTGEAFS